MLLPTDRWIKSINDTTDDFVRSFGRLTLGQLNWKPNAVTWSIAQNIDHLITINSSYFPILDDLEAGAYRVPFTGKIKPLVPFLGNLILRSVQPDRKRKMKTFSIWEPTSDYLSGDIVAQFQSHQEDLMTKIVAHKHLIRRNPVISSPANRFVVYRLQTAFEIMIMHERRHYVQAAELLPFLPD